jgi:alkylation response protein AidB-like acyl-CoA dehydrogenase
MIRRRIFEDEHNLFRDSVRKWVEAEIVPNSGRWREEGMVSRDIWRRAGEEGFLCIWADEKYGGLGLDDFRFDQILMEEIMARETGFFLGLHSRIVAPYFQHFATEEQKDRFMPGIVSGETILSIAMTEPGAGSDLAGMKTHAVDAGDHWVLNGSKTYISNGILSDLCLVAARTNPERPHSIGLFLVEGDMPGFQRGRKLKKLGLHSQDTAELFFEDVKVPKDNVMGDPGMGFKYMMRNLAEERLGAAVISVAHMERAFALTLSFIKERTIFGKPLGTYQNSRFKMADMRTRIDAAQSFVDHCVMEHIEGQLTGEMAAEAKLFTSEVEGWVLDECVQLHGGAGYMEEYEICRLYADVRVSRIFAGTSEIMREIIGRSLGLDDRAARS